MENRPRAREKNVTEGGKGVHLGGATGMGSVGSGSAMGSGGSSGGGRSGGQGKLPLIAVIIMLLLGGGGFGVSSMMGGGDGASQSAYEQTAQDTAGTAGSTVQELSLIHI